MSVKSKLEVQVISLCSKVRRAQFDLPWQTGRSAISHAALWKRDKMSVFAWKRRVGVWTHFAFDIKENWHFANCVEQLSLVKTCQTFTFYILVIWINFRFSLL